MNRLPASPIAGSSKKSSWSHVIGEMFGGPHRVDELTRTEPVGWTGKTIRELRRSAGPRNNGAAQLWECVRKEQKKELNTLDEADFVRDVEKSASHHLSHSEIDDENMSVNPSLIGV